MSQVPPELVREFANRFNILLKRYESQSAFCAVTGLSPGTVSNYAAGSRLPDLPRLKIIAERTGTPLDWLLGVAPLVSGDALFNDFRSLCSSDFFRSLTDISTACGAASALIDSLRESDTCDIPALTAARDRIDAAMFRYLELCRSIPDALGLNVSDSRKEINLEISVEEALTNGND